LPLYYLADATITLLRRVLSGERFWRAHREHFYQKATQGGLSHARVVEAILLANLALLGLALWASVASPWPPLGLGALAVAALLAYLATRRGG
jgi:UDP-N-acetylmuramyl pentapeptide phosphotransferase/UDP-N-acetylglucosamine-1-phosphate transferase